MPYWLHGRDATSGAPRDSLFVEVESEDEARRCAAEAGLTVEEVEFVPGVVAEDPLPEPEIPPAPLPERVIPSAPLHCARCGSARVVPRAAIWDRTGDAGSYELQAYVYANPSALVFRGAVYATLYARVCGRCGHAELFADGAEGLYEAYKKSQSDGQP
jgi:hypothetical protein